MKCTSCAHDKPLKAKKIQYDYSKKCGIANCFISAKQYTCPKCKETITDLGEVEEINKAIGEELVQAEMLTRQMVKYVRVHFFDESTFQFAKRIGQNPTFYDELENLKRPMTDDLSYSVQEQIIKRFLLEKLKPITLEIGDTKIKFKRD